jgi:hypothetical protein
MYKTERIASGNGSERLAISWHTLLIGQNLPQSLTLGSAKRDTALWNAMRSSIELESFMKNAVRR